MFATISLGIIGLIMILLILWLLFTLIGWALAFTKALPKVMVPLWIIVVVVLVVLTFNGTISWPGVWDTMVFAFREGISAAQKFISILQF